MRRIPFEEPDWTTAPEWARFWAVDESGIAYWYALQPEMGNEVWWAWPIGSQSISCLPIGAKPRRMDLAGLDWRKTLRERGQP